MNTEYNAGWAACEAFYAAHNRIPTDPQLKPVEAASESAEAVQALLAGDPRHQTGKPQFVYFQNTDGGMETHEGITGPNDCPRVYGWMHPDCAAEDTQLLEWMLSAEAGDMHMHRLGVMVRLKDAL